MAAAWAAGTNASALGRTLLTPRIDSSLTPDSIARLRTRISRGASCATLGPRKCAITGSRPSHRRFHDGMTMLRVRLASLASGLEIR
jgi:hypothetical protein